MKIYTAIFGGYDQLQPLPHGMTGICFTDQPIVARGWEIRPAAFLDVDPRKRARHHKCMSHLLFPGESVLWIDGSMQLLQIPPECELGVFRHRRTTSASEEFAFISQCNRWPSEEDRKRAESRLSAYNVPITVHPETGFLVRKDTPAIRQFNERWWAEIDRYSIRDQLSFSFAAQGIKITVFEGNVDGNIYMSRHKHLPTPPANIYFFTPYDKRGLGMAYNRHCAIVPDDAWICLMDNDLMFFPSSFGDVMEAAIKSDPAVDVWVTKTTRVSCNENLVCPNSRRSEERDLVKLQQMATECYERNYHKTSRLHTPLLAGYVLLFRKSLWKEFPFSEQSGNLFHKIMGIDIEWSQRLSRAGKAFGLIEGLMAVHYYSLDGNRAAHIKELEANVPRTGPTVVQRPVRPRAFPPGHFTRKTHLTKQ